MVLAHAAAVIIRQGFPRSRGGMQRCHFSRFQRRWDRRNGDWLVRIAVRVCQHTRPGWVRRYEQCKRLVRRLLWWWHRLRRRRRWHSSQRLRWQAMSYGRHVTKPATVVGQRGLWMAVCVHVDPMLTSVGVVLGQVTVRVHARGTNALVMHPIYFQ